MVPRAESTKFPIIQALRGVAALAVCWIHFTQSMVLFPAWSWVSLSGRYGWLGVEAFFVISGFIVSYSLLHGRYRLTHFLTFLWKRIVRVDPPYIVSIAVSVIIALVARRSPLFAGPRPPISASQIALHLGYLIPFAASRGYDWVNGVYWTLSVEFQYYLMLALLFPLISAGNRRVRIAVQLCLCLAPAFLSRAPWFLPHYIPLFLMGIAGMLRKVGVTSRAEFWFTLSSATISSVANTGWLETAAGLATITCIMNLNRAPVVLLVLGDISYSLYLIHQPIGARLVNLGGRFIPHSILSILPFAALGIVLVIAYAMYILIERPAKRWASRIRYTSIQSQPAVPFGELIET